MNFSSIGLSNITATTFTLTFVTPIYINYFQGFVAQSNSYTTAQQINNAAGGSSPTAFMDFGLFFPVKNNTATTLSLGFSRFNSSYSGFGEQLGYPFCPGFNSTWYYYLVDINGVLSRPVAFTYSFYTNTLRLSTTSYTTLTIANLAPILSVTSDATVVYSYAGANSTTYGPSATKPTAIGTYKLSYTGTGGYFYCSLPILFTVTQASDQTLNVKVNNTTQVYTGSPLLLAPVSFSRRFIDTRFNISWDETSIIGTPTVTVYYYILVNSEYIQVQHMYYPGTYYVNALASAGYKARLVDGHAALGYQRLDIVNGTNLPYVAGNTVGNNNATNTTSLLTSPNLITWTSIPAWYGGVPGQYLGGTINIITVNDVMFAVGADSAGLAATVLLYSADGVTWAKPASMPAGLVVISTLTYINGYYIAACSTGSQGMVMYATDYTGTWTAVSTKFYSSTTGAYVAGTFGLGVFVIVGGLYQLNNSNPVSQGFYYSTDLISNYTYVNTPGFQLTGTVVEFDGTKFIAVGWETGANNFRVSYDGKAWSSSGFSGDTSFTGVPQSIKYAFMNHLNRYLWIAVSGQQAKYSTDGLAWANYPASSGILNSFWNLTWSGARWFVGVVDSSVSYQFSFDGITWYNIYIAQVNSSTYHSTTGGTMFAKERYLTDIQPISLTNAYTGSALTPSVSSVTLPSPNQSLYYQDANGNSIANMINAGNYTVTAILWGASGATKYAGISKYAYTVTPATPTLSASATSASSDPTDPATQRISLFGSDLTGSTELTKTQLDLGKRWLRGFSSGANGFGTGATYRLSSSLGTLNANGNQDRKVSQNYGYDNNTFYSEVILDGDVIYFANISGTRYSLWVNDNLISSTATLGAGTTYNASTLDFSSSGGGIVNNKIKFSTVARRKIKVAMTAGTGMGDWWTRAVGSIRPAYINPTEWIHFGDSFSQASGATSPIRALADYMAYSFGRNINFINVAQGGTSFSVATQNYPNETQVNSQKGSFYQNYFSNWKFNNPKVITCLIGHNDASSTQSVIASRLTTMFQDMRATFPNAIIIVFTANTSLGLIASGNDVLTENTIINTINSLNLGIFTVPMQGSLNVYGAFLRGTGRVGSTTGVGNTDLYVSSDSTHPSDAGHKATGLWMAERMYEILKLNMLM